MRLQPRSQPKRPRMPSSASPCARRRLPVETARIAARPADGADLKPKAAGGGTAARQQALKAALGKGGEAPFSREAVAIEVGKSIPGARVVRVLDRLARTRGLPRSSGVRSPSELWGRTRLSSRRQVPIARLASARLTNQLWFKHSSRNFPLKLSTKALCVARGWGAGQGAPDSASNASARGMRLGCSA